MTKFVKAVEFQLASHYLEFEIKQLCHSKDRETAVFLILAEASLSAILFT